MNHSHRPTLSEAMHVQDGDIAGSSQTTGWIESGLAAEQNERALHRRVFLLPIAAAAAIISLGVFTAVAVTHTKPWGGGGVLPNVVESSSSSEGDLYSSSAKTVTPIRFGGADFQCGDNVLDYPVLSDIGLSYAFHHDASSSTGPDWIVLDNASSNTIRDIRSHVELLILDDSGTIVSRSGIPGSPTGTFAIAAGQSGSVFFTRYSPGCIDSPTRPRPGRHPATLLVQATTSQNFTRIYRTDLFSTMIDSKGAVTFSR